MKVREQLSKVETSGYEDVMNFEFVASPQAFSIVIDKLYTDPILAIIRELSANAWDAHVEAGTENKAFDIHLPSYDNMYFMIRDYGTGITVEKMENVYRKVFESDKTRTNDQTGCFGLGCKTPLAYTSNYMIESFIDGKQYIYNGYIGEDGIPKLAVESRKGHNTKEPNGLKITIPTKSGDQTSWQDKAKQVFRYFKMLPNFVGKTKPNITPRKPKLEKDNWAIYDDYSSMIAVMGNIAYPIRDINIKHSLAKSPIEVRFEIGDLDVTPSRDDLQYSKRTIVKIENELNKIQKTLNDELAKKLSNATNLWEARIAYLDIQSTLPSYLKTDNPKWNGLDILPTDIYGYKKRSCEIFFGKAYYTSKSDIDKYGEIREIRSVSGSLEARQINKIYPKDDIKFILVDEKTGFIVKAKHYKLNNTDNKVVLCKFDDNTKRDNFVDLLGIDESYFIKVSSLPKPATTSPLKGIKRGKTAKICKLDINGYRVTDFWKNTNVDIDDGKFYVELNTYKFKDRDGLFKQPSKLKEMINELEVLGYPTNGVYGIKTAAIEKIVKKGKNWRNFIKYFYERKNRFNYDHFKRFDKHHDIHLLFKYLPKDHPLQKEYGGLIRKTLILENSGSDKFVTDENVKKFPIETIVEKYPLLDNYVETYYSQLSSTSEKELQHLAFYLTKVYEENYNV